MAVSRNRTMIDLGVKAVRSRAFRGSDAFFDEFVETLTSMGGIYAKFLQGILLGYSVSRGKKMTTRHLDVFEDNPDPHFSTEDIARAIGEGSSRLALTSTKPLGVGSYSAVYSAVLDDNIPVVVKILRPHIKEEITIDLKFLRKLAYIFRFAGVKVAAVDIVQFYSSFKKACVKETDFVSETAFAHEMYLRYKDHPTLVVPKTYLELCNERVIVQEKIEGVSAKTLVEARLKDKEDIKQLTSRYYGTDLINTVRVLSYEMFYAFMSGKSFHGDLHPGNVRILPGDKIAILDFGIKAEPYAPNVVAAAVNKLESDALFLSGDIDPVRILDAHFRLYMAKLYQSVDSLLTYYKKDVREFFEALVKAMGIELGDISEKKKKHWMHVGPAAMLNELLKGSEKFGIEVKIRDQTTTRAISTQFSLLKALGMSGEDGLRPVYEKLCPRIRKEQPELFSGTKKMLPDLALENVYNWLESLTSTNPELARKLRKALNEGTDKQLA